MKKFLFAALLASFSAPAFSNDCGGWQWVVPEFPRMYAYHNGVGDNDMGGNNPVIDSSISFSVRQNKIVASGSLTMREGKSDWSTFTATRADYTIFEAAQNCVITELYQSPPMVGRLYVPDAGKNNHRPTWYPGSGAISGATCLADTDGGIGGGSDSGQLYCEYKFNGFWAWLAPRG